MLQNTPVVTLPTKSMRKCVWATGRVCYSITRVPISTQLQFFYDACADSVLLTKEVKSSIIGLTSWQKVSPSETLLREYTVL